MRERRGERREQVRVREGVREEGECESENVESWGRVGTRIKVSNESNAKVPYLPRTDPGRTPAARSFEQ